MQKIRAHHLESIKLCSQLSRDAWAQLLILGDYVSNPEDPFVDYTFNKTREILSNSEELLEVIAGEEDMFCKPENGISCPLMGLTSSCPGFDGKTIVGYAFYPGKKSGESRAYLIDEESSRRTGLNIGEKLSVGEIKARMKFQS